MGPSKSFMCNIRTVPLRGSPNQWQQPSRLGFTKCRKRGAHSVLRAAKELIEVEDVKGIRLLPALGADEANVEYLVEWKGEEADSWEPKINLSPDLVRDFEEKWWEACRKHDRDALEKLLRGGGEVLAQVCDENGRTALHFAVAIGRLDLVELLLAYGADSDIPDKDGYTPLHMASGYLQLTVVQRLLDAGADPDFPDDQGRTPLSLMEGLRDNLPMDDPASLTRRMALERVIGTLTDDMYEVFEPVAILDMRTIGDEREFLVQWPDNSEDSWVPEQDVAEDIKEDYINDLEYGDAEGILKVRNKGDERFYLVRWKDDYEDTWEPEENVSDDLIKKWDSGERIDSATLKEDTNAAASESKEMAVT